MFFPTYIFLSDDLECADLGFDRDLAFYSYCRLSKYKLKFYSGGGLNLPSFIGFGLLYGFYLDLRYV